MLILKVQKVGGADDYFQLDLPGGGIVTVRVIETGIRWARLGIDAPAEVVIRRRQVIEGDAGRVEIEEDGAC